jgi:hypothetical protein
MEILTSVKQFESVTINMNRTTMFAICLPEIALHTFFPIPNVTLNLSRFRYLDDDFKAVTKLLYSICDSF